MRAQFRQGDILLLRIESLPVEASEQKIPDRIVLAYGEVTGHAHAIASSEAKLYVRGSENFIVVPQEASLVHEEHNTITLRAGVYKIIRQREYEPVRGIEYVLD